MYVRNPKYILYLGGEGKIKKYGANAPQLHHILAGIVVIVRARVVEWGGGDPCGRPGVCQHPISS
jgi:hypothetical protein